MRMGLGRLGESEVSFCLVLSSCLFYGWLELQTSTCRGVDVPTSTDLSLLHVQSLNPLVVFHSGRDVARLGFWLTSRYQSSHGIAIEAADLAEEYLGRTKSKL